MKNKSLYIVFAVVAAILLYLFSKKTTGFLAPTSSGALPITGYQGATVLGQSLSSLPPTGVTSTSGDSGGSFVQGPTPPPGYDPNNPSTWPSQGVAGVTISTMDPSLDTLDAALIYGG
jgi:hypothetical protein